MDLVEPVQHTVSVLVFRMGEACESACQIYVPGHSAPRTNVPSGAGFRQGGGDRAEQWIGNDNTEHVSRPSPSDRIGRNDFFHAFCEHTHQFQDNGVRVDCRELGQIAKAAMDHPDFAAANVCATQQPGELFFLANPGANIQGPGGLHLLQALVQDMNFAIQLGDDGNFFASSLVRTLLDLTSTSLEPFAHLGKGFQPLERTQVVSLSGQSVFDTAGAIAINGAQ